MTTNTSPPTQHGFVHEGSSSTKPDYLSKFQTFGDFQSAESSQTWLYNSMLLAHKAATTRDYKSAAEIYPLCITASQQFWGTNHIETIEFQRAYANVLTNLNRVNEAADVYQSIQTLLEAQLMNQSDGSNRVRLTTIFEEIGNAKLVLVKTLYKQNNFKAAARISNDNFKLCKRILGEAHDLTIRAQKDRDRCLKKEDQQKEKQSAKTSQKTTQPLIKSRVPDEGGPIRRSSTEPSGVEESNARHSTELPETISSHNIRPFEARSNKSSSDAIPKPRHAAAPASSGTLLNLPQYKRPSPSSQRTSQTPHKHPAATITTKQAITEAPKHASQSTSARNQAKASQSGNQSAADINVAQPNSSQPHLGNHQTVLAAPNTSAAARSYGETIVQGQAHAVLGDYVQHLYISGPVYLQQPGQPAQASQTTISSDPLAKAILQMPLVDSSQVTATANQRDYEQLPLQPNAAIPGSWPAEDHSPTNSPRRGSKPNKSHKNKKQPDTSYAQGFGLPCTNHSDEWFEKWLKQTHSLFTGRQDHVADGTMAKLSRRVRIALLDTGIDYNHPYIIQNLQHIKQAKNFVSSEPKDTCHDTNGHGTHLATLLSVVAPDADLFIARAFSQPGSNDVEAVIKALKFAVEEWKVDIVCMSFGFDHDTKALRQALQTAQTEDKLIFAAATNEGANVQHAMYPARYPGVFCIHATDSYGSMASFNTVSGDEDYSTLGVDVMSAKASCLFDPGHNNLPDDEKRMQSYHRLSGTSVAAAIAAAIAALILEFAKQSQPVSDEFRYPFEKEELEQLHTYDGMKRILDEFQVTDRNSNKFRYLAPWNLLHPRAGRSEGHAIRNIRSKISYALCKPR